MPHGFRRVIANWKEESYAKLIERAEQAEKYVGQSLNYKIKSARLISTVNVAASKALDAGKSYTGSLEHALVTEKRLVDDLRKLGLAIGTPLINASSKDVAARASTMLNNIQSQIFK